jgi:cbb3-type cytochrome oxidase subunit 3
MGTVLGIVTAVMLVAFAAIAVWAWLPGRRAGFARAAALPLRDESELPR